MRIPAAISDYRTLAEKRLPRMLFDFIDTGAFEGCTIRRNSEDFKDILLHKRVLKDVSKIDTQTVVLGQTLTQPVILAPIGYAGLLASRGEAQAAKAAQHAGVPFCLSTLGICSIEEVQRSTTTPFWFQLYMIKDKAFCLDLLQRAEAAQCPVLIVTVDVPVTGIRYQDIRNGMVNGIVNRPLMAQWKRFRDYFWHSRWAVDVPLAGRPLSLGNIDATAHWKKTRLWVRNQIDQNVTWKEMEWLRAHWKGKLVLKGISDSEDARLAVNVGADGIVVSNHAGRHLDSLPSSISMLRGIAEAVGDSTEILFDGGIGSGLDLIKSLALGAKASMIGRPWAFALGARGERGVKEVLAILHHELKIGMAQLGVTRISDINSSLLHS